LTEWVALVSVAVNPAEGTPQVEVSPDAFAWLKEDYGPGAWEWAVCDDYRAGAVSGSEYALSNIEGSGAPPPVRVVITRIRAHPAQSSPRDVFIAACCAVWKALGVEGARMPQLSDHRPEAAAPPVVVSPVYSGGATHVTVVPQVGGGPAPARRSGFLGFLGVVFIVLGFVLIAPATYAFYGPNVAPVLGLVLLLYALVAGADRCGCASFLLGLTILAVFFLVAMGGAIPKMLPPTTKPHETLNHAAPPR
jgi:hypothetical protein